MLRDKEQKLYDFCKNQHKAFDTQSWLIQSDFSNDEMATVALFLAGGEWYGHRDDLFMLANKLHEGCLGKFSNMAKLVHFDCSRFNNMLREQMSHE